MATRLISAPASEPITLAEAKGHLRLEHALDDAQVTAAITAARQWAEQYLWRGIVTQTWELLRDGFPCEDHFELPKGNLGAVSFVKYLTSVGGSLQTLSTSAYLVDAATEPGRILLPFGSTWPTTVDQWNSVQVQYTVGWGVADAPWAPLTVYAPGDRVLEGGKVFALQPAEATSGTSQAAAEPDWSAAPSPGDQVEEDAGGAYGGPWTWQNVGDAVPNPIKQALLLLVSQMYENRTPEVVGATISSLHFAVESLLHPYRLARF